MPSARGFASPIHARSGSYAPRYGRRDCRREPRAPHAESFLTTASSRPGRQPTHHRLLDIENTRQLAVVVVRPPVDLVPYSNQLSSDANAASFAPHATFEHLVYRFTKICPHYSSVRASNFFHRCTTGSALISSMPFRIRSRSSSRDCTRT